LETGAPALISVKLTGIHPYPFGSNELDVVFVPAAKREPHVVELINDDDECA
jgi:hypothetical protein